MRPMSTAASRADLDRLIARAQRLVVFTGAGISTESGIPDFRSPGGVWSRMKPIYFQDFVSDPDRRREAWERAFSGRAGWVGRAPNAGHEAVARLVASGKATCVITQNVDNLHQASGVPEDKREDLSRDTCMAGKLCAPAAMVSGNPDHCKVLGVPGVCLDVCFARMLSPAVSVVKGQCRPTEVCMPCLIGKGQGMPGC